MNSNDLVRKGLTRPSMRLIAGVASLALGLTGAWVMTRGAGGAGQKATTRASASASAPESSSRPVVSRPQPVRERGAVPTPAPAGGPIDARVGGGPIDAGVTAADRGTASGRPSPVTPSGQALNALPPPGDKVEVFKDNQWLPAQVLDRKGNQVYVRYDGYGDAANEWVGPNRLRSR